MRYIQRLFVVNFITRATYQQSVANYIIFIDLNFEMEVKFNFYSQSQTKFRLPADPYTTDSGSTLNVKLLKRKLSV